MTSVNELRQLIEQGEDTQVEFKVEVSEDVLRDLPTRLAAIANSQGGRIIFGVANNKEPKGLTLKGDERDRISQSASNCAPPIPVELEEVRFGNRSFIVVRVPRSKVVHSDPQRKFPVRIGTITGYLDTFGLVSLLQERSIIRSENLQGLQLAPATQRKREPISDTDVNMIVKAFGQRRSRDSSGRDS